MKKLYYDDSYLTEFEANVIECRHQEGNFAIILDRSCFYPESGGQPSDVGFISDVPVIYVIEKDNEVLHIVQSPVNLGPTKCSINWIVRFDHMQQHTGQHILSACFDKLYNGRTSSFTIGSESSTIEIDITNFDFKDLRKIEDMANSIIFNNVPVTARFVDAEELSRLPLRKAPRVTENIRVVEILTTDYSPCGGTHVRNTGEIGIIKIKRWEKLKSSYKFYFVCGSRAVSDYRLKNNTINYLGSALSVKEYEIEDAFNKLVEDQKAFQRQFSQMKQELLGYEAVQLIDESEVLKSNRVIIKVFENRDINDLKLLAQHIIKAASRCIVLLASKNQNIQLVLMRSDDIDSDMGVLIKHLLTIIEGKGGGNSKLAQGGGSKLEGLEAMIAEARAKLQ